MEGFDNGWDAQAILVDGRWVERIPRRAAVAERLRREAALLPWLAPQVPLAVPHPVVVSEDPLRLRHLLIVGDPCSGDNPSHATALGGFLAALHAVSPDAALGLGVPDAQASYDESRLTWDRFRREVAPMIGPELRPAGAALLDRIAAAPLRPRLAHCDVGPAHVRVSGDEVTGIIDWTDACLGDPAVDLAWALHGTTPAFAHAFAAGYGADEALTSRALDWHLLGPWHEVIFGLDTQQPALVESGLSGVVQRLRSRKDTTPLLRSR